MLLLDLSAAFDTVDHNVLTTRLSDTFGIDVVPINWFRSYLSDRYQVVCTPSISSDPVLVTCGVPQGSVLGPVLLLMYVDPLKNVSPTDVWMHQFFDDTQIGVKFRLLESTRSNAPSPSLSQHEAEKCLQVWISRAEEWFTYNSVKLNVDKSVLFFSTAEKQVHCLVPDDITIGDRSIQPLSVVTDLGVIFDSHLSMNQHMTIICRKGFGQIFALFKIRRFLPRPAAKCLFQALVLSHVDYANSLLVGLPKKQFNPLRILQNAAARFILCRRRFENATPLLKYLKRLPVDKRIELKEAILTFKCIYSLAPFYLSSLVHRHVPARSLRSVGRNYLTVPSVFTSFRKISFSYAASTIWNTLPDNIRRLNKL